MSAPAVLAIVGGIATGVGNAFIAKEEREAEEEARIAEEKRREERYKGIGEAAAIEDGTENYTDLEAQQRKDSVVGARAPRMGDKYTIGADKEYGVRGLPQRPKLQKPMMAPQTSVSRGAAPMMGGGSRPSPQQPKAALPRKPRHLYNPQSGRIEYAG